MRYDFKKDGFFVVLGCCVFGLGGVWVVVLGGRWDCPIGLGL